MGPTTCLFFENLASIQIRRARLSAHHDKSVQSWAPTSDFREYLHEEDLGKCGSDNVVCIQQARTRGNPGTACGSETIQQHQHVERGRDQYAVLIHGKCARRLVSRAVCVSPNLKILAYSRL